jgi:hypothetical protein
VRTVSRKMMVFERLGGADTPPFKPVSRELLK